ncbi:MAG: cytochrome c oxidase subunit II [Candidatus Binataceae bacterium]|nr:cytochrome c oxidase subunit II [Candidatus Binataceae bacterium]
MPEISTLNPLSPFAAQISHLFVAMLVVLGAIFLLVLGIVTYAIVKYRDRPGAPPPRQTFGSRNLEIAWTLGPIILLAIIFVFTVQTMRASDPPISADDPLQLRIIGHQWWWEADYLKSGVIAANEIHIPVGQRWLLDLESADVIHDFWVAELVRKIDMVPGHPNHVWLEADRPGTYFGVCAEFCGNEHAWMRFRVIAQPLADFQRWQQAQLRVPPSPTGGAAAAGLKLFEHNTCVNCHTIAGTPGNQQIGPDLSHLASRTTIAAGAADNTPGNLYRWLKDPNSIKPDTHMPNFQLSDADAKALTAYLETLK